MIHLLLLALGLITACNENNEKGMLIKNAPGAPTKEDAKNEYSWAKLSDNANWAKSYNFQMFSIRDSLLVLHHDGVWTSGDGQNWIQIKKEPINR